MMSSARNGRTLVLAIHQLIDAERVCDRFVLLVVRSPDFRCGDLKAERAARYLGLTHV
jgi:hypothetical protein